MAAALLSWVMVLQCAAKSATSGLSCAANPATSGHSLVQFNFRVGSSNATPGASGATPQPKCSAYSEWPGVDNEVTCGSNCTALVLVDHENGGRCGRYCESFGHVCVAAAEEVAENCEVKYTVPCDLPIRHTSDMLCTCHRRTGGASNASARDHMTDHASQGHFGWYVSGQKVGHGWCQADVPAHSWKLPHACSGSSGLELKVLTYNLFWWNLFNQHGGGSAGQTIADGGRHLAYDIMAFQECDDMWRVLHNAGLSETYTAINGGHATAIAYKTSRWELLAKGNEDVAEDQPGLYGRRVAAWVRLRHWSGGKVVFFVNHHGPLHVDTGGRCGGDATAYNILRVIGKHAHHGDFVVVTGDFNAAAHSSAARTLDRYLKRTYTGTSFGGVDHFFAGCPAISTRNLGGGGSDHDALEAVFRL